MKTLFIFGAGASKPGGAPLMADFLDRADALYRKREIVRYSDNALAFHAVFNAISELGGIYAKAHLDLDNIETLFGTIEMAQVISRFGPKRVEDIAALRQSIVTVIVQTLESSLRFPVQEGQLHAPYPYDELVKTLRGFKTEYGSLTIQNFSFITFNYDVGLDYALNRYFGGLNYCLSDNSSDSQHYRYLKLHGSTNWGFCDSCKKVIPIDFDDVNSNGGYDEETKYIQFEMSSHLGFKQHCDKPLGGSPVIIPPTWNKTDYHGNLAQVWKTAADELASAENIFLIGYSLPKTDLFFRYLFALGTESTTRLKRFWVFNPNPDLEENFRDLLSRNAQTRFQYFKADEGQFEYAIAPIIAALNEDFGR